MFGWLLFQKCPLQGWRGLGRSAYIPIPSLSFPSAPTHFVLFCVYLLFSHFAQRWIQLQYSCKHSASVLLPNLQIKHSLDDHTEQNKAEQSLPPQKKLQTPASFADTQKFKEVRVTCLSYFIFSLQTPNVYDLSHLLTGPLGL